MNPPTETLMMGLLKKSPRVTFVLGNPLMGATIAEAASAWERSLSVQRCSYVIESVRTAYGARPA